MSKAKKVKRAKAKKTGRTLADALQHDEAAELARQARPAAAAGGGRVFASVPAELKRRVDTALKRNQIAAAEGTLAPGEPVKLQDLIAELLQQWLDGRQ